MATVNLSNYDFSKIPSASSMRFGVLASNWNNDVTDNLLAGCVETLLHQGCPEKNIITKRVPGTYELPLAAQFLLENTNIDAVVCLGSVIQGETKHFDFVCDAAAQGIKDVMLKYNKPVIFGVLTDNTKQQALDRSGGSKGNKGVEAAVTAIEMVALQNSL